MSCERYEERIALYAGGDLTDDLELEAHLAECAECAAATAQMRDTVASLRELHEVETAPLPLIRGRVLESIGRRHRRWTFAWWPASALAAAVALAVMAPLQFVERAPLEPPRAAVFAPKPPENALVRVVEAPRRDAKPAPVNAPVKAPVKTGPSGQVLMARAEAPAQPMTIKLLTSDPDVVIIWLVDGKESSNEDNGAGVFNGSDGD